MNHHINNFNDTFAPSDIELAPDAIENKSSGQINQHGWFIQYLFGTDARGEFLDYHACHRMTNDRHVRLYADGRTRHLNACQDWCKVSDDPVESQRFRDELTEYSQRISLRAENQRFRLVRLSDCYCKKRQVGHKRQV